MLASLRSVFSCKSTRVFIQAMNREAARLMLSNELADRILRVETCKEKAIGKRETQNVVLGNPEALIPTTKPVYYMGLSTKLRRPRGFMIQPTTPSCVIHLEDMPLTLGGLLQAEACGVGCRRRPLELVVLHELAEGLPYLHITAC